MLFRGPASFHDFRLVSNTNSLIVEFGSVRFRCNPPWQARRGFAHKRLDCNVGFAFIQLCTRPERNSKRMLCEDPGTGDTNDWNVNCDPKRKSINTWSLPCNISFRRRNSNRIHASYSRLMPNVNYYMYNITYSEFSKFG